MLGNFTYTDKILYSLEEVLSSDRLTNYLAMAQGNREKAIRLYLWNAELSEALQIPVHILEVAVRNAIHKELSKAFSSTWYDDAACPIKPALRKVVQKVKNVLIADSKPIVPSRIISRLTMAFWVFLLSKRYETSLWRPYLYNAFPNAPKPFNRRLLRRILENIRLVRNRIAHHEPILTKSPDQVYTLILRVLNWISPDTTNWLKHHSRFDEVWKNPPV